MQFSSQQKDDLDTNGNTIIPGLLSDSEIEKLEQIINGANIDDPSVRRTQDLFAIRRFFEVVPAAGEIILNASKNLVQELFGKNYFVVKSIYFDKPGGSNWFVAYHQDLTISVNEKADIEGYNSWTIKDNRFSVHPPVEILEKIYTIRIHLDSTDENNGALRIIPGSHKNGIVRGQAVEKRGEVVCKVERGGAMIMRPLLFHASSRSINSQKRRIIHIELCNIPLPAPLTWAEQLPL